MENKKTTTKQIGAKRFNEITYSMDLIGSNREAILSALPIAERRAYEAREAEMDRADARSSDTRGTY